MGGSCQCCGDFEYRSPRGGVQIYASPGNGRNRAAAKAAAARKRAKKLLAQTLTLEANACVVYEVFRENEIVRQAADANPCDQVDMSKADKNPPNQKDMEKYLENEKKIRSSQIRHVSNHFGQLIPNTRRLSPFPY